MGELLPTDEIFEGFLPLRVLHASNRWTAPSIWAIPSPASRIFIFGKHIKSFEDAGSAS